MIGTRLTNKLNGLGHRVIPASPRLGVNTLIGEGLKEVLRGAEVVIDVSNPPSTDDHTALEFFRISGENLMKAETRAAVGHHIVLSLVGTERLQESGYFRAKKVQENLVRKSGLPHTIIHSTQFFESAGTIADASVKGEEIRLAPSEIQPIAADDVCRAMARVAGSRPFNRIIEIAGPDVFSLPEFILRYLTCMDDPRRIKVDARARYFGALLGNKTFMPEEDAHIGPITYDAWMKDQLAKAWPWQAAEPPLGEGSVWPFNK